MLLRKLDAYRPEDEARPLFHITYKNDYKVGQRFKTTKILKQNTGKTLL